MKKFKIQLGMFLVISLLLTSVLTATGIVLIKVTVTGKNVSESFVQVTTLLNQSAISAGIIEQAIDTAVPSDSTANIYLVDISGTTKNIVKEPSTKVDLSKLLFEDIVSQTTTSASSAATSGTPTSSSAISSTPAKIHNSMKLKSASSQKGYFTKTHKRLSINDPMKPEQAQYTIKISAYTCDDTTGGCQIVDKEIKRQRSCPRSTDVPPGRKKMRALKDEELPSGYTNDYPNLYCTCADGSYTKTNADGSCSLGINCTANQYYNGTSCVNCASGYYSIGGQVTTCTACATGCANCSYTPRIGVRCTGCAPNYNGPDTFGSCTSCPVNNFYSGEVCIHCDPGYYSAGGKVTTCTQCATGCANCSYTPRIGVRCTGCAPNYNGPDTFGTCTSCPVNNFYSGEVCIPCDPGSYSAGGKVTTCTSCSSITGCIECSGANTCTKCNNGYYIKNGACSPCPTYATCTDGVSFHCYPVGFTPGADSCTCAAGAHINLTPSNGNILNPPPPQCELCFAGTMSSSVNSMNCTTCPANTFAPGPTFQDRGGYSISTSGGSTQCTPCATGTYSASNASGCLPCNDGNTACATCPTYTPYWYNGGCHYCPLAASRYQLFCTHNRVDATPYQTTTQVCVQHNLIKCKVDGLCSGNQYRQVGGCTCPSGTTSDGTVCQAPTCPANCANCTSPTNCSSCNAGYYLNGGTCTACPAGTSSVAGSTSSNSCIHCDPGTYAASGASSCAPCPSGYTSSPMAANCFSMMYQTDGPAYPPCADGLHLTNNNGIIACTQ